jgi:hypothetical protein
MWASSKHLEIFACGLIFFFMFNVDDIRKLMKNTKNTKNFERASKNTKNKVLQTSYLLLGGLI